MSTLKIIASLKNKLSGLLEAINRYPLTMLFLIAAATVNVNEINHVKEDYSTYLFTFIIGALLSAVAQQLYERFFTKKSERFMLMGGSIILTVLYYFAIHSASVFSMENGVKTGVMIFALTLVFIWVPTIKNKLTFNESFMSVFKAFFITVLFTGVIAGGISLILFAIDQLLFSLDYKVYSHALNPIYTLFAPIFFLSFTPFYLGKKDRGLTDEQLGEREETINKAIRCPKNLSILISYIIIPLTAVYTIILVIYVLLNIRGDFWTENLLEPMLVSYAITVILVYILASHLDNSFANLFRKVFPKVLIPIVLFQTIASFLKIGEIGLTHSRYYVILFGIFALIVSLIFSFLPPRKNGLIAAVLIIFSVISITPPIDAFTVSRVNQTNLLEKVLVENKMLENGEIIPNANISTEDKKTITRTVQYLDRMNYIEDIAWLPNKVFYYDQFKKTFGFNETYDRSRGGVESRYAYLDSERNPVVNIAGFDVMIEMHLNSSQREADEKHEQVIPFEKGGLSYTLTKQLVGDDDMISITDAQNETLIEFHTKKLAEQIFTDFGNKGKNLLTVEEATITEENERVKLNILVISINEYDGEIYADLTVFVKIK